VNDSGEWIIAKIKEYVKVLVIGIGASFDESRPKLMAKN
jgi:hypothetical protein